MKTLIVMSDTHGGRAGIDSIKHLFKENDYIIHLGDGVNDMRDIYKEYPDKTIICQGNCDLSLALADYVLEVEKVRIYMCHGHRHKVKAHLYNLAEEAKNNGCQLALYGHTHRPRIDNINGITLVNPGSFRYPVGKGGSYCYIVVDKDKFNPILVGADYYI